jgi:hypothetical protein
VFVESVSAAPVGAGFEGIEIIAFAVVII